MNSEFVAVRSFTSDMEAEIAKSALEAFCIECMISRDDCGGERPHLGFSGGRFWTLEWKNDRPAWSGQPWVFASGALLFNKAI